MIKSKNKAYIKLISAMLIWGTLGVFVKKIPLESSQIVIGRVLFGGIFLSLIFLAKGRGENKAAIKKYGPRLLLSGFAMGFNWVALFTAYNYTTVSMATVAYYLAPIIVMVGSVFILKEKINKYKILGISSAMIGLILITGNLSGTGQAYKGLFLGLIAAALYASVTLINKKVSGVSGLLATLVQLAGAFIVVFPYSIIVNKSGWDFPGIEGFSFLVIIGVIHTGMALYFYFSAIQDLPAQSVALCSYIDPASTLIFSAVLLGERIGVVQLVGAVLILGGAAFGELYKDRKEKERIVNKYEK